MRRGLLAVSMVLAIVLAGCLGGPAVDSNDPGASTPSDESGSLAPSSVPGVTNGSLTNATALARANERELAERGGVVDTSHDEEGSETAFRLRAEPGLSNYTLSGTYPGGEGPETAVDVWNNGTGQYVRTTAGDEVRYRVVGREHGLPNAISSLESYIASGAYGVGNDSGSAETVVLTASEPDPAADERGPFGDLAGYDGRVVVDESGVVRNATITAVTEGRTVTYRYQLRQIGLDAVEQPDWVDAIPESATLRPDLDVTVENGSYLVVRHRGGDDVPANSTLEIATNETTRSATFARSLGESGVRYASLQAGGGGLRLAAERPDPDTVVDLTSPISVSLTTDDGVNLYSASMGWGSESASESASGSASENGTSNERSE